MYVKGALVLIYTTIRYPHKIFLKMILVTGAIAWIPASLMVCLNPLSIVRTISKSKIVNNHFDELAELQYKLKVRLANIIDKEYNMRTIQKKTCWSV